MNYSLTRNLLLRALGFIYFVAYLSLNRQVIALIGKNGILPATLYLQNIQQQLHQTIFHSFLELPSIFWFNSSDSFLLIGSWLGLILAVLMMAGVANAVLLLVQWFLYMSFVHIGQTFYQFGWEIMTLEAGFLAIFLCPLRRFKAEKYPAPKIIFWFYRWMLFRVMFGAGLIKIRGDECWRDLTCLAYHYETQPIPNAISWYLHQMPMWFHKAGCLFNHFVELIVPFFFFAPRRLRHIAGILTIIFQLILILSGNLSFLNWLTAILAISCFDDEALSKLLRRVPVVMESPVGLGRKVVLSIVSVVLIGLSLYPLRNMLSPEQVMNASFDRLHLMNTYGAFGVVNRVRNQIIIEGTNDAVPDDSAAWKEYEFLAKPGDPKRRPVFIAPYQSRIDWQMWFAAMSDYAQNPWLIHFIYQLLKGDEGAIHLLRSTPFSNAPPRFIRAVLYEYHFTRDHSQGVWWDRKRLGLYLPPLSVNDPELKQFIHAYGWD